MTNSKKQKAQAGQIDREKFYGVDEAIGWSRAWRLPSSTRRSKWR